MTQSNVDVSSEAQRISTIKHWLCFCQYKLSIIDHLLSRGTVFKRKLLAVFQMQTNITHATLHNQTVTILLDVPLLKSLHICIYIIFNKLSYCRGMSDINTSQGSVATHLRCSRICNKHFNTTLLEFMSVKIF